MLRKLFVGIIGLVLVLPLMSFGQSTSTTSSSQVLIQQLQEQIQAMQAQITTLQAQLKATREEVAEVKAELKITRSLYLGVTGDDVKQLQEFLKGFPDIYPEGLVTGYFGPLTETAVRKLQEKQGIETIGIVGPKTLSKINELLTQGAGESGVIPPGVTTAPGIQKKLDVTINTLTTTTALSAPTTIVVATTTVSTSAPSAPATLTTPATPATPATPTTPAQPAATTTATATTPNPTPIPTIDTTPPSSPILSATAVSTSQIDLSWLGSTDSGSTNIAAGDYRVCRQIGEVVQPAQCYADSSALGTMMIGATISSSPTLPNANTVTFTASESSLQPATAYTYFIVAYDAAGNRSQSNWVSVTTLPTSTPTPTSTVPASAVCTDSDGGKNYYVTGSTLDKFGGHVTDYCTGNYVEESFCLESDILGWDGIVCPNGCVDGACVASPIAGFPKESLNQMASVLKAMQGILNQIKEFLKNR